MMRSRRESGNGLISGYKKVEEEAREKVVSECAIASHPPELCRAKIPRCTQVATPFAWSIGVVN